MAGPADGPSILFGVILWNLLPADLERRLRDLVEEGDGNVKVI